MFLDYGRGHVIFEPNSSFNNPFLQASAGLTLVAEGDDYSSFRVIGVLENSPASEVSLLKDDVIIAVDGQPSKSLTLSRLNDMFEQPVVRKLTIRRGESTLEITFTPKASYLIHARRTHDQSHSHSSQRIIAGPSLHIEGIRLGFKDRSYAIPFFALALNIAWELQNTIFGFREGGSIPGHDQWGSVSASRSRIISHLL